jgi:hypothetical protein
MSRSVRPVVVAAALAMSLAPAAFAAGPFQFHSVTPCRIVDTRNPAGPTGGPVLSSGVTRNFPIQGQCGVPTTAEAATLNVTIASPTNTGHLSLWPAGSAQPLVSTLNYVANEPALANGAIVPLAANAPDLAVQAFVLSSGTVHVIIDVTGYFE